MPRARDSKLGPTRRSGGRGARHGPGPTVTRARAMRTVTGTAAVTDHRMDARRAPGPDTALAVTEPVCSTDSDVAAAFKFNLKFAAWAGAICTVTASDGPAAAPA